MAMRLERNSRIMPIIRIVALAFCDKSLFLVLLGVVSHCVRRFALHWTLFLTIRSLRMRYRLPTSPGCSLLYSLTGCGRGFAEVFRYLRTAALCSSRAVEK